MDHKKLRERPWYPYAVAACIAVTLYVLLMHLGTLWGAVKTFSGYFLPVFLGCILAYLMNPLAKLYQRSLFHKVKKEGLGWSASVILAVLTVVLILLFLLGTLIPQLISSGKTLVNNFDGYLSSLQALANNWGISGYLNVDNLFNSSGNLVTRATEYLSKNLSNIVSASASAGKGVFNWVIALILSVYLLSAKTRLKAGATRLLRSLMAEEHFTRTAAFLRRCDDILSRYIVFSLLDAAIVGVANLIFMGITGMQYAGLVSVVVAVTNLIPTFGPIIGAVIGGFVLLLVHPMHALIFLIFTFVLKFLDGYVIKPRLFGNSLGVSGLQILIAVIVGGNIIGVVGNLLAIPFAAILDFVYREAFLPAMEHRAKRRRAAE